MKKRIFLPLMLLLFYCPSWSAALNLETTHRLDLFAGNADEPMKIEAIIYEEQQVKYISFEYEGCPMTTEIMETSSNEYKFQLAKIRDYGLVSIHFIGLGTLSEEVVGHFSATVDGLARVDMSGRFSLVKTERSKANQNTVGGHVGVVQPLLKLQKGNITGSFGPNRDYSIGFPMGVTIRKNKHFAFDLEVVPSISFIHGEVYQEKVDLLIHPGLLWGIDKNLTFGSRAAFELGEHGRYGITPLLNLGNIFPGGFVEVVVPIRVGSKEDLVIALGIHLGIGL